MKKKRDSFGIAEVIMIFVAAVFGFIGAIHSMIDWSSNFLLSVIIIGSVSVVAALLYVYFKGEFKS